MKKIILSSIFAVALLATAGWGMNKNMNNDANLSDLALANVEALAQDEGVPTEKIYRYEIWNNDECYVLVGGAYAKGKKVTCWSGTEHPVCVECKL